jgi:hypothetical protein
LSGRAVAASSIKRIFSPSVPSMAFRPTGHVLLLAGGSLLTYGTNKLQANDGDGTFSGSVGLQW